MPLSPLSRVRHARSLCLPPLLPVPLPSETNASSTWGRELTPSLTPLLSGFRLPPLPNMPPRLSLIPRVALPLPSLCRDSQVRHETQTVRKTMFLTGNPVTFDLELRPVQLHIPDQVPRCPLPPSIPCCSLLPPLFRCSECLWCAVDKVQGGGVSLLPSLPASTPPWASLPPSLARSLARFLPPLIGACRAP